MFAQLRRPLLPCGFLLLVAATALAQTTMLEGNVKDQSGPVKGAVIVLDRTDIKGHYTVKTDKKGHWLYMGLPSGTFDISCQVNGATVDKVSGVHSGYGDNPPVDFDLAKAKQQTAGSPTAQLTDDQARGMSKEQKAAYEEKLKKNEEAIKKNKALDDAFNAGKDAATQGAAEQDKTKKAADYQTAIDSFKKASDIDAQQSAVWSNLGEAYYNLGQIQTGDDRTKSFDAAIDSYKKALALNPTEAGIYNQMGNIYGAEKKMPEATEALNKAAELNPDPHEKAKAYFNMGANLVNSGNSDGAIDFFQKAIAADPNYADAHYQYGICLMGKAQVDSKTGKVTPPPGTAEEFQKYLELKPDGPNAQASKDMLASLGETVQTKVTNPNAKKKK